MRITGNSIKDFDKAVEIISRTNSEKQKFSLLRRNDDLNFYYKIKTGKNLKKK